MAGCHVCGSDKGVQPVIKIENVSFTYGQAEKPSLAGISLTVHAGECVLLCGKSGCGKTTVTRLLNGMIPDFYQGEISGSIRVNGLDPVSCSMYELSKCVGTVFQNPRTQFYTVNTTSEIAFGCENHGMKPEEIRKRVMQTADDLNMTELLNRNIFQLSGGEKQKIAFAGIYALNPDIYVLDEPSSNLDCFAVRELRTILEHLKRQGKTIILAEHRIWYLKDLVDRAVYMERGEIVRDYSMAGLAALSLQERLETGIRPVFLSEFPLQEKECVLSGQEITMQDIRFSYKKQPALDVKKAVFPSGRITAVVGENGAGKSTFVSVLCGILNDKKGSVFLNKRKLSHKNRLSMSYMVMQEVNHQLFTDSVEEEVTLGIGKPSKERLEAVLSQMDILELKDRHPMTLSGGQKQRVAVAAAMFCGKKILIFDEPTSGLDFTHMMKTAELLKKVKSQDAFIFVITHDYEFILSACDDVIHIDRGNISKQYKLDKKGIQFLKLFFGFNLEKKYEFFA